MRKLNARLSVRRETLTRLNQESLAEAAGGTLTLPPNSYRICLPNFPTHNRWECYGPIVV